MVARADSDFQLDCEFHSSANSKILTRFYVNHNMRAPAEACGITVAVKNK